MGYQKENKLWKKYKHVWQGVELCVFVGAVYKK
jgi:hypothetical protein